MLKHNCQSSPFPHWTALTLFRIQTHLNTVASCNTRCTWLYVIMKHVFSIRELWSQNQHNEEQQTSCTVYLRVCFLQVDLCLHQNNVLNGFQCEQYVHSCCAFTPAAKHTSSNCVRTRKVCRVKPTRLVYS